MTLDELERQKRTFAEKSSGANQKKIEWRSPQTIKIYSGIVGFSLR